MDELYKFPVTKSTAALARSLVELEETKCSIRMVNMWELLWGTGSYTVRRRAAPLADHLLPAIVPA